jgi:FkbM family methyltransferase
MTSLRRRIRMAARKVGVDLVPYPEYDPLWRVAQVLKQARVDLVLDVGANDGGYASTIRSIGYEGRVISFEPLSEPYRRLTERAAGDDSWSCMQYAIGASTESVEINIAGNAGASSSVLPMLDKHVRAEPTSAYVGVETVPMRPLDRILEDAAVADDRIFLKIDVQGFEGAVLDGANDLLQSARLLGLQMELSFTPMYEGGMTWQEGFARAEKAGLVLAGILPGFSDPVSGQMYQADAVFIRAE